MWLQKRKGSQRGSPYVLTRTIRLREAGWEICKRYCTLNGADGRLEVSADGKWLICRPIAQRNDSEPAWHPGLSLADGERIKEEVYLARVRNGEEAWKNLGRS